MTPDSVLSELTARPLKEWPAELAGLCRSGELKAWLAALLRDDEELDRITRASFYHPTGAFKLTLASRGYDGPEMRLHIWTHGSRIEGEHNLYSVHNHKWSFASYVVQGTFQEQIFGESAEETELAYDRYRFDSAVRGKEYQTTLVGRRFLSELFSAPIDAGTAYLQSREALHSFQPADERLSITLFVRTAYRASHTDVYVPAGERVVLDGAEPKRLSRATVSELTALVRDSL